MGVHRGISVLVPGVLQILAVSPGAAQDRPLVGWREVADTVPAGGPLPAWDGLTVASPDGEALVTRYEIRRTNTILDRHGQAVLRDVTSLVFRHVGRGPGAPARFEWELLSAQRGTLEGMPPAREIALPAASSYTLNGAMLQLEALAQIPGPEHPADAAQFHVLALDAVSLDVLLRVLHEAAGPRLTVGTRVALDQWNEARPVPGGTYRLGSGFVGVSGLTRVGGEACLEVSFSADGSLVSIALGPVSVEGREYVHGTMAVALGDGRIVAADIWGPLMATFRQSSASGTSQELPFGGVMQHVTLRELPPSSEPEEAR